MVRDSYASLLMKENGHCHQNKDGGHDGLEPLCGALSMKENVIGGALTEKRDANTVELAVETCKLSVGYSIYCP